MKGDYRLDVTLDRTAREAVDALSRELAGPVAQEVGREVRANIDPVTDLLRNETSALTRGATAVREAVEGLESELVRTLQETVADVGTQTTERMVANSTEALRDQIRAFLETLGSAIGRLQDESQKSLNAGNACLAAVDASLKSLRATEKNAAASQAEAAQQITCRLEALETALADQRAAIDEADRRVLHLTEKVETLQSVASEHQALTAHVAKCLGILDDAVRQLREAQGVWEHEAIAREEAAQAQRRDLFLAAEAGHVRRERLLVGGLAMLFALALAVSWKVLFSS